jgi:hypothetical protein
MASFAKNKTANVVWKSYVRKKAALFFNDVALQIVRDQHLEKFRGLLDIFGVPVGAELWWFLLIRESFEKLGVPLDRPFFLLLYHTHHERRFSLVHRRITWTRYSSGRLSKRSASEHRKSSDSSRKEWICLRSLPTRDL